MLMINTTTPGRSTVIVGVDVNEPRTAIWGSNIKSETRVCLAAR